jgi:aspartyl-tRNA(Asn)/glutamyl-tRNA(Gln) amidotransferase subunit A
MDLPVPDYSAALTPDLKGVKVGVPREYFIEGIEPGVERAVRAAIDRLKELGAEVREVGLPHTDTALPVYYLVAPAEASANLARFDGIRYGARKSGASLLDTYCQTREAGFGQEVKRRIMLGTYALSAGYYDAYYLKAQKVRTLIKQDFDEAFAQVDVIACPVSPSTAFRIGEKTDDPLQMYLSSVHPGGQPGRHLRRLGPLWVRRRRVAGWPPANRSGLWRGAHLASCPRLRAGHGMASACACA